MFFISSFKTFWKLYLGRALLEEVSHWGMGLWRSYLVPSLLFSSWFLTSRRRLTSSISYSHRLGVSKRCKNPWTHRSRGQQTVQKKNKQKNPETIVPGASKPCKKPLKWKAWGPTDRARTPETVSPLCQLFYHNSEKAKGYPSKAKGPLSHVWQRTIGCKHPHNTSHNPGTPKLSCDAWKMALISNASNHFCFLPPWLVGYISHSSVGGGEEQEHLPFFSPLTLQKPQS